MFTVLTVFMFVLLKIALKSPIRIEKDTTLPLKSQGLQNYDLKLCNKKCNFPYLSDFNVSNIFDNREATFQRKIHPTPVFIAQITNDGEF